MKRSLLGKALACACLVAAANACGGAGATSGEALRGLPPRHDPPLDLGDDGDLGRARNLFDGLAPTAPARPAKRRELVAAYVAKIDRAGDNRDEAFRRFRELIGMWEPRELADQHKAPDDLVLVAPAAERLFKRASASGLDLQAATALAVLIAAHPEKRAEYDKTWKDIVAYTNDLAVAEDGPGAERSRAIQALEVALTAFPSRWVGDRLIELYLA